MDLSHYDNSHAFGFREAACLQFEGKLQFKRTYAELSESKPLLKLTAATFYREPHENKFQNIFMRV